jgi:hypothetical protein
MHWLRRTWRLWFSFPGQNEEQRQACCVESHGTAMFFYSCCHPFNKMNLFCFSLLSKPMDTRDDEEYKTFIREVEAVVKLNTDSDNQRSQDDRALSIIYFWTG